MNTTYNSNSYKDTFQWCFYGSPKFSGVSQSYLGRVKKRKFFHMPFCYAKIKLRLTKKNVKYPLPHKSFSYSDLCSYRYSILFIIEFIKILSD